MLYKSKKHYVFEYYKKGVGFVRLYEFPPLIAKMIMLVQRRFKNRSWGIVICGGMENY